jgi:peptide/nickel transport system substrate-binding protein
VTTVPTRWGRVPALTLLAALLLSAPALAEAPVETPYFADKVAKGALPPVAERLPRQPLTVDLAGRGRSVGKPGGDIVTLVPRARDIRYLSAYAYGRLVGYDEKLALVADLVDRYENEGDRVFTFHLRDGHRWSDGHPVTAEDFRYFWDDVANNKDLSPAGVPEFMLVEGKPPRFEALDERTVRYSWEKPNPRFLPSSPPPRPVHLPPGALPEAVSRQVRGQGAARREGEKLKLKNWATLHNRLDDMNEQSNPDLPDPPGLARHNAAPANRFVFERNPFYHRVDAAGHQLPYVDRVCGRAAGGLLAAKANAGEADLLFRGLSMADIPILRRRALPGLQDPPVAERPAAASSRCTRASTPPTRSGGSSTATCASAAPSRSPSTARP